MSEQWLPAGFHLRIAPLGGDRPGDPNEPALRHPKRSFLPHRFYEYQRKLNVLQGRKVSHQMKLLENDS